MELGLSGFRVLGSGLIKGLRVGVRVEGLGVRALGV